LNASIRIRNKFNCRLLVMDKFGINYELYFGQKTMKKEIANFSSARDMRHIANFPEQRPLYLRGVFKPRAPPTNRCYKQKRCLNPFLLLIRFDFIRFKRVNALQERNLDSNYHKFVCDFWHICPRLMAAHRNNTVNR
jgi:hypothetical protein